MACNGQEHCTAGACVSSAPVDCNDHVTCTVDHCDDGNGSCSHMIMDALCTMGLVCDPVTDCSTPRPCTTDAECDDHIFCTGVEHCDMAFGCRHAMPPNCDDAHSCTTDTCDAATDRCVSTPDNTICSDGQFCNGSEVCAPSDPAANSEGCIGGTAPTCSDAIACTVDTCDETMHSCVSMPSDALCNDHVFCNGIERCDVGMNGCRAGTTPTCDDAIGCTLGTCNAAMDACVQMANDAACSDSRVCNGMERCDTSGATSGTGCVSAPPLDCTDGMSCTTDGCVEPGMCTHGGSDADGDGHTARGCAAGDDCDDLNMRIHPGAAELCDGIDNDCSGATSGTGIDDGPGMQCAYLSAPTACTTTCSTAGTQPCDGACHFGTCRAAAETCNGCDDDVDGRIDEAGGGSSVQCRAGDIQACTTGCGPVGTQTCNSGCAWGPCVAAEICNGCDDDGNGVVDNGFTLGGSCTAGIGECTRTGSVVCRSDHTGTTCSATAGLPVAELCNGRDDNCNGSTDEAFTELGFGCTSGLGVCRHAGVYVCRADATGTQCSAIAGTPGVETCNGIDDNCNGVVDDGADGGACDGMDTDLCLEGTNRCVGGALMCDDTTGNNVEICNGVDDNCDGTVDEGCACTLGMMRSCYTGPSGTAGVGICHAGAQTCVAGPGGVGSMWGSCSGAVVPGSEICNNMDDDCNGAVDNGNPGGGASCDGPDADLCAEGTINCTSGSLVCSDMTGDNIEICDGADNNCNGTTDEGNPGGGVACDGSDGDLCLEGTTSCSMGTLVCSDNTTTNVETCNGLDDNCNGSIDEGNPGGGAACDGPDADLCNEGTYNCVSGSIQCSDTSGNNVEVCGNGIDDDCDPSTSDVCPGDTCANPIVLTGTTGIRSDTLTGAVRNLTDCGNGVELIYQLTASVPSIVYLTTLQASGATLDTEISYRGTTCPGASQQCVDDSCGVLQTQFAQYVPAGTHFFAVHAFSSAGTGAYQLTYGVYPAAGGTNTFVTPTPTTGTARTFTGATSGSDLVHPPCTSSYGAGESSIYWLQCPADSRSYAANTCTGTNYDSVIYMLLNGSTTIQCNDDGCGYPYSSFSGAASSGAGLVQLFVDGFGTNVGNYSVAVTF